MTYSIIGTGNVGKTLAAAFAAAGMDVALANARGKAAVEPLARELGATVAASSVDEALEAEIVFVAVPFLKFKDVGSARPDWSGKIVVDVTNAFMLPPEVQEAELNGRLSSEVNADRVPGAKLVKAFNQLRWQDLLQPVPDGASRVVFIASDHEDASSTVAELSEKLGFAPIKLGKVAEGGRLIQAPNALVFQDLVKFRKH